MADDPTTRVMGEGPAPDPCGACGAPLAADQRYCLNCGQRKGGPRIDYAPFIGEAQPAEPGPQAGAAPPVEVAPAPSREPSPIVAVAGIALLGLMLMVGVLIGRGDGSSNDSAPAPAVVSVPSDGTVAADAGAGGTGASGGAGGADGGGQKGGGGGGKGDDTVKTTGPPGSGSGSINDPEVASRDDLEALENATGAEQQEASQNLPDTIALPGEAPPVDNQEPGGGTGATVIK